MTPLLLDTCAAIWMAEDKPVAASAVEALDAAAREAAPVFISPMSAWGVGLLVAKRKVTLSMSPEAWFRRVLEIPGVVLAELSAEALIASSFLPGTPPRDPVDRIIAATARAGGYRLVTRDRQLLAYAEQGHLAALAC
jgi:PIN domain nuclease of toxin-antitoxin system